MSPQDKQFVEVFIQVSHPTQGSHLLFARLEKVPGGQIEIQVF